MCKLSLTLFAILSLQTTLAQVSGDFWWLHKETENINGKKIPAPKFENVTTLENDEYDKVIFKKRPKDLNLSADKKNKNSNDIKDKSWVVHFPDWDDFISANLYQDIKNQFNNNVTVKRNVTEEVDQDLFTFNFPDDEIEKKIWPFNNVSISAGPSPSLSATTTEPSYTWINNVSEIKQHTSNRNVTDKHKLIFRVDVNYNPKSESICTFIGKEACLYKNGTVYKYLKRYNSKDKALVCCILPLKRSQKEVNESQRERIVFPDYSEKGLDKKLTKRDVAKKSSIVTPGDDSNEDPYANIRNHRVTQHKITNRYSQPTSIDYLDEVPTPGLLGYYNADDDNDYWQTYGEYYDSVVSEEDGTPELGYGIPTTNPRHDERPVIETKKPKVKLNRYGTTSADDLTVQVANHVVNYHSNPDFLVLKGYKLLNLVKNFTRLSTRQPSKPSKSTTDITASKSEEYSDEDFNASGSRFNYNCDFGDYSEENEYSSQNGGASQNRQPWVGVVSRNRQTRKTSCYATLIHPKAAISVTSCVLGSKPSEVTFYIGSKLNIQRRTATVRLQKGSGGSLQNVAVLHWSQPLKLNADVKPVCLDQPIVGETCILQAWTLRERDLQSQIRKVRVVFLNTKDCTGGVPNAFCAFLKGDGSVPQLGGVLVCTRQGRQAAVGVMMAQRSSLQNLPPSQIVVLPIRQWTLNQLRTLGLD